MRIGWLIASWCCGVWLLCSAATPTEAQSRPRVTLPPAPGTFGASGLKAFVDWIGGDSYGYRSYRVTVNAQRASAADRAITVRFETTQLAVEQDFDLPAGVTTATTTISVPIHDKRVANWTIRFWVDGTPDRALTADSSRITAELAAGLALSWEPRLFALSTSPSSLQHADAARAAGLDPARYQLQNDMLIRQAKVSELPTRWIDWSSFDLMSMSVNDLDELSTIHPESLHALTRWIRAGGCLTVTEAGREWEHIPAINVALGLSDDDWDREPVWPNANEEANRPTNRGTMFQQQRTRFFHLTNEKENAGTGESDVPDNTLQQRMWRYRVCPLALGKVVATKSAWDDVPPYVLFMTQDSWSGRHGLAPDTANPDFANWLIPGVGLAPVTAFRVLITVFVLGIGPLNYWLLTRWHRQHLLVISVPVTSALVTVGLFAYAFLSDGLGTRVRIRSYAELDQRSGEAVCWSRHSYYAGLAPSRGLTLPSDIAIFPIVPGWKEYAIRTADRDQRELLWSDAEQHLTRGWLNSRRTTQYLFIRARNSPNRIVFANTAGDLLARNELNVRIEQLCVFDQDGQFRWGEGIPVDGTLALTPVTRTEAFSRLLYRISQSMPEFPAAFPDRNESSRLQQRQVRQRLRERMGTDYGTYRMADNLLNLSISRIVGLTGQTALSLRPKTYIAITRTGPEVDHGIPRAREQDSLHVTVGKW